MSKNGIKKIRRNAIIGGLILTVIATLHLIKGHIGFYRFLYILAGFLFIVGGFFPSIFKQIADIIGRLIVSVLLSTIFFIVITPMGIVMRIFGKNTLDKDIDREKDSYWIKKEDTEESIAGYEKQF